MASRIDLHVSRIKPIDAKSPIEAAIAKVEAFRAAASDKYALAA